jgi:hypothetical protein
MMTRKSRMLRRAGTLFLTWLGRFGQALRKAPGVFGSEPENLGVGKNPKTILAAMSRFAGQSTVELLV